MTQDWKEDLKKVTGQPTATPKFTENRGGDRSRDQIAGGIRGREFWPQYFQSLKNGYFDKSGHLRPELIVDDAQQIADRLEKEGMSRSLLRNFYGEVAAIRYLVRQRPTDFDRYKTRILKLQAYASNATHRRTGRAPESFFEFISSNVGLASRDTESFLDGFCEHFECIVLYFRGR